MSDNIKKVKLGLIGAGWVARQHLEAIKHIDWIEASCVFSRTRSKAELLASEYGIRTVSDGLDSLVKTSNPDALMVLVSEEQMFKVGKKALEYGLPVFFEKPAGLTPEENGKLAEIAKKKKVSTMVGFNRRYYSIFHKGIEKIKEHGKLRGVFIEGHERMWRIREGKKFNENVLANWIFANSTHTIDLLRFFGGEIVDLKSIAHKTVEARGDQFAAIAELESGAIGEYVSHWYSPGGWKVVLYGDGVTVEFRPLEKGIWIDKKFESHEILPDEMDTKIKPGFYGQMKAFGELVAKGKKQWPILDLEGAYKTMMIGEKISWK